MVIFGGSGATGAIAKMIDILGIRIPAGLDEKYALSGHIPAAERPIILVGPYEHHSNEIPWRESVADVVEIPEDSAGQIDLAQLRCELERFRDRPLKIGSFSAASNVTGIVSNTHAVAETVFAYILDAVDWLATEGWRFLPEYRVDAATGQWTHRSFVPGSTLGLGEISYTNGVLEFPSHRRRASEDALAGYLAAARELAAERDGAPDLRHSRHPIFRP